ncbi:hypothetical protein EDD11_005275 [Mortierella claussenii]|nr:hypothetical protein EDD11_005275 [Mortierella claussenii]
MSSLHKNPLDLPEIIARVGHFIPLWVQKGRHSNSQAVFRPQSLLAACAVNHTFRAVLWPLIWSVFDDHVMKRRCVGGTWRGVPSILLSANSSHFRFFKCCVAPHDINLGQVAQLQELTVSQNIDHGVARALVLANPRLKLLSWQSQYGQVMTPYIFEALHGLHQLETLHLDGWKLEPGAQRLFRVVLKNNSDHLRSLSLILMEGFASAEECWVLLPKLSIVEMDNDWDANPALLDLFQFCPALETLKAHADATCDIRKMAQQLRDHCPRLNAIRCVNGYIMFQSGYLLSEEEYVELIQGSTTTITHHGIEPIFSPGLVHFEMALGWLDSTVTDALLVHAAHLETLELYICGDESLNFKNASRLLSQCRQLRRFSLENYLLAWNPEDGMALFEDAWACQGLESFHLYGFSCQYESDCEGFIDISSASDGLLLGNDSNDDDGDEAEVETEVATEAEAHIEAQAGEQGGEETGDSLEVDEYQTFPNMNLLPGVWCARNLTRSDFEPSIQGSRFKRAAFEQAAVLQHLKYFSLGNPHYYRIA